MKTFMANEQTVTRKWYVADAAGVPLGRLASQVAAVLRGKNKPEFTPGAHTFSFLEPVAGYLFSRVSNSGSGI